MSTKLDKWVVVVCENWECNDCTSGNMCPHYSPHEVQLRDIPKELREFYEADATK